MSHLGALGAVAAMGVILAAIALAADGTHDDGREPAGRQRLGSFVQADALGNTHIGGPGRTALAFRFRATWTGSVAAVRLYIIRNVRGRTGYSGGTGGILRVALQKDSGRRRRHVPRGRPLATATLTPRAHGFWPLVHFNRPGRVAAGRLYHIVFTNVDRDPERNYVSINALFSESRSGPAPAVPDGLAVLAGSPQGRGGQIRWHPRGEAPEHYLPIVDVVGSRPGQHAGLGYMEVWGETAKPVGGKAMVRQLLRTPGGTTTRINGAWLRVRRSSGTNDPLVLRIERPGGKVIASAAVAPGKVPTTRPGWVHVRFASPASPAPNTALAFTASAASASAYRAFPVRKGPEFGFDRSTVFDGGYAQFNDGSGWIGWDQWGGHDQRNSDLQFALDVAR
jgi:hypothetical protein